MSPLLTRRRLPQVAQPKSATASINHRGNWCGAKVLCSAPGSAGFVVGNGSNRNIR